MNKILMILKNLGLLLGVLLIFLFAPSLIKILLSISGIKLSPMLTLVIANSIVLLILVLIFIRSIIKDFKDFKINYKKYLKFALKCWAIGLGVMMLSNLIINFIIFHGESIAGNEESVRKLLLSSPILGMISASVIAPISEELTFRMGFKKLFNKMLPFAFVSTFVFAGLHVITDFSSVLDLLYLIPYGSLGFAFAIAYYKTNNIFSTISMHMIHNFLTFGLVIISYLGV